ncbi:MAG: hypothetical protein ACLQGP_28370 [Isosphaeraceae bacterium]
MPRMRKSFSERRRRILAFNVEVDRLESRSTVTPMGATALGLGLLAAPAAPNSLHASKKRGRGNALIGPASAGSARSSDGAAGMPMARGPETETSIIAGAD